MENMLICRKILSNNLMGMKKPTIYLLLSITLLFLSTTAQTNSFTAFGGPSTNNRRPSLALLDTGIAAAWIEASANTSLARLAMVNAGRLQILPSISNSQRDIQEIVIASHHNALTAAWTERERGGTLQAGSFGQVQVATLAANNWQHYAPSPSQSATRAPDSLTMRLDRQGWPVLAWSEVPADFNSDSYYLSRWQQAAGQAGGWQVFDNGSLSTDMSNSSRSRDFALDSNDQPLLAWSATVREASGELLGFNVFAGRWGGIRWQPFGAVSLNNDRNKYASLQSIVLDAENRPFVAWVEAGKRGFGVFVKHWTGTAWEKIGAPISSSEMPAIAGAAGYASTPKIALDPQGRPVVAWLEMVGADQVLVKRWNGQSWQLLGASLNVNAKAWAQDISLVLDKAGLPVVAWMEEINKQQQSYARRWNGQEWVGL
jgi:hypothetical protein